MSDWNPELYMEFKSERTQPSIDLVNKISCPIPKTIIDIGCGPGNSTQVLTNRWPGAKITGLDNSAAMIEQAEHDYPGQEWIQADAASYQSKNKYDIVFSNAAIQWMPDHEALLNRFFQMTTDTGLVAIQMPQFFDMPLGKAIRDTAVNDRWLSQLNGISANFNMLDYSVYYDILSHLFDSVEMWETDYFHVLKGHEDIIQMMRSTGLKPYHERLHKESDQKAFETDVLSKIADVYPKQQNGNVLLPFKRLFFIGSRQSDVSQ